MKIFSEWMTPFCVYSLLTDVTYWSIYALVIDCFLFPSLQLSKMERSHHDANNGEVGQH